MPKLPRLTPQEAESMLQKDGYEFIQKQRQPQDLYQGDQTNGNSFSFRQSFTSKNRQASYQGNRNKRISRQITNHWSRMQASGDDFAGDIFYIQIGLLHIIIPRACIGQFIDGRCELNKKIFIKTNILKNKERTAHWRN